LKIKSVTLFFIILFGSISHWQCAPPVKTQNFGPDEYFEYSKKLFDKGKYTQASSEFTVIVLKFSGNPVVDDAQYYLSECHFKLRDYIIAVSEYQKLINDYPESPYVPLAQFKKGLAYHKLSSRAELDQEYTVKAMKEFQIFVEENPDHEFREDAEKYITQLREKLAKKKLIAATTYRKMGIYDSAVIYYDIIINDFYDTRYAPISLFWKAECLLKMKKFNESRVAYSTYIEKYPNHRNISVAKRRVEKITDELSSLELKEN